MPTIDETRSTVRNLQQRLEFETLISDLSSRFINLRPGEFDREIEDALRRVCELLGIDLAVLWQWSDLARDVAMATHVYAREGAPSTGPFHQAQFPWWSQEMLAGRLVAVSSLNELPAAADIDRENCRLMGVKSNLTIPLDDISHPAGSA